MVFGLLLFRKQTGLLYAGIFKRHVGVSESAEKMVVGTHYSFSVTAGRFTDIRRQQRRCPLYLFSFLMNWQPRHSSLIVIGTGFALLFLFFRKDWMLFVPVVTMAGFVHAGFGEWIHRSWMKLALVLGWINSRILLTILFFVVLTPVALVARLLGKTSIRKQPANGTQLITRHHLFTKNDLQHPW